MVLFNSLRGLKLLRCPLFRLLGIKHRGKDTGYCPYYFVLSLVLLSPTGGARERTGHRSWQPVLCQVFRAGPGERRHATVT